MSSPTIQFYNRQSGQIEVEKVYGEGFLRFAYENPLGRAALHLLLKRRLFSQWYGWRMDSTSSRSKIPEFIDKYSVDTAEFANPAGSYQTFNEFFYRKLLPEARPIDSDPHTLVFPADGRHLLIPDASQCSDFFIKGTRFDIAALVADKALAEEFHDAAVLISRLCPVDYHRFHFPSGGLAYAPRAVNGPLYSVSPIALLKRPSILWENKRCISRLHTDTFGSMLLLEIGATCVGSILHTAEPDSAVLKGDEKGYFRFGGSCFITLVPKGRVKFSDDLIEHSAAGREVYARMGEVCGVATP
ncbi:MAG: phosphatidylserine decarboxylase [Verrucomicrobiales bacterium]|nr:phosphatidylserine decarboxylase [Verrucomicrobiales bacterium]MCP5559045.1 phosphatidylserine decarboxylase [Verrucomicrobiaceae bacterium]